ncbi:MAG: hypothetical protein AB1898_29285 [Acidobacteriota bacterium]
MGTRNEVDQCAVCRQSDFYVRDEVRKIWGLGYLLMGLALAPFTYGLAGLAGLYGFYWHFFRYPKVTICYHCYAKYHTARLNPEHLEYDLEKVKHLERAIRNDQTYRDFRF